MLPDDEAIRHPDIRTVIGIELRSRQRWLSLFSLDAEIAMNITLLKALVALVPACMLFSGSAVLFTKGKTVCSFLQLLGAGCLGVVVLTHVCEALQLFPWMYWGLELSVGHYLDFWSAVLGLTLFPVGYLFDALTKQHA